jgi:hypothetical protein
MVSRFLWVSSRVVCLFIIILLKRGLAEGSSRKVTYDGLILVRTVDKPRSVRMSSEKVALARPTTYLFHQTSRLIL